MGSMSMALPAACILALTPASVLAEGEPPARVHERQQIIYQQSGQDRLLRRTLEDSRTVELSGWEADTGRFDISANGRCLAAEGRTNGRSVQIFSLSDDKIGPRLGTFPELRDPRWSADGRTLAATINTEGQMAIALVDVAREAVSRINRECMSAVKGPHDDIFCQNASEILVTGSDGKTRAAVNVVKNVPNAVGKMPASLDVSDDGSRVLVEVSVRAHGLPSHDGHTSLIYLWDRHADRLSRVSPPDMFAREPRWVDSAGRWLFIGFELDRHNKQIINAGGWPAENLYLVSTAGVPHVREIATRVRRYAVAREAGSGPAAPNGAPLSKCGTK